MRPVLEEMNLGTAEEEQVRRRTTAYAGVPGGFIYLGGPLMQGYLNAFGCKLALAMHWEATMLIVPVQGGVALRVYSNVKPDVESASSHSRALSGRGGVRDG
jgi:hypothetical protein